MEKKVVVAVVGGFVLIAGAAWYFLRTTEPEEGPKLARKKPVEKKADVSATPEAEGDMTTQSTKSDDMLRTQTTMLVNEYSFEDNATTAQHESKDVAMRPYQPPTADGEGNIFFESLGIKMKLTADWSASEEPSPMPTVALLAFAKPEFLERDQGEPGAVPMVLLTIEDVTNEKLTVDEFKEKSKMMALGQMQQMAMMSGSRTMPRIVEEEKLAKPIGPFTHLLMYELIQSPEEGIQVLNLTALQDGLAYVFQVMASPKEFNATRKAVVEMAKSTVFLHRPEPEDFATASYVTMSSVGGTVTIPPSWSIDKSVAVNPIFTASSSAQSRKEVIEIYNKQLDKVVDLTKSQKKSTSVVQGVTVSDYGSSMRVAEFENVLVVATVKHSGSITTSANMLAAIAKKVDFTKTSDEDKQIYRNVSLSLGFDKRAGRIVESRLAERIVVYAPNGLPNDPTETDNYPMLTIRVGDPSNDPDCRTTLDEWMQRIQADGAESVIDLKKETINGRECVTFMSKEEQQYSPYHREVRFAKMVIFLTGIRTTFLRWETTEGAWRKHEGKLRSLLNSFVLPKA